MSTFRTSRGTRAQHVSPIASRPSDHRTPAHRQHIYGRIQPMDENADGNWLWLALALASPFLAAIISWSAR